VTVDGQTVFAPNAIPDSAIAQYDATQLNLNDGDDVTSWSDGTGSGNDLSAGTAPKYKTNIQNGNSVVRFSNSGNLLADITQEQPFTTIFVTLTTDKYIFNSSGGSGGEPWHYTSDSIIDAGTQTSYSVNQTVTGVWNIWTIVWDDTNTVIRVNGTQEATPDPGTDGLSGQFELGGGGRTLYDGDIGEFLIYNTGLSSSTIDDEESRLSDKWGITI
jgi:hypothetical protein